MNGKSLRGYLLTGLIIWLPIIITFVVLRFIVDLLDQTIALLPNAYQPEQWFGMSMPGLGVLFSLVLLLLTGLVATNLLGQRLVAWSEHILDRIPLVRSIYSATKQVIRAIFATNGQAFRQVLLIEYPRKGIWTLAFQTGTPAPSIHAHIGVETVSVFVPTTPNPTAGFLLVIPKADVIPLTMSVDDALKCIISLGVMQPADRDQGPS